MEVSLSGEEKSNVHPVFSCLTGNGDMKVFNKKSYPLVVGDRLNFKNINLVAQYVNIGRNFSNLFCAESSQFEVGSKHMFNGIEYEVTKVGEKNITVRVN